MASETQAAPFVAGEWLTGCAGAVASENPARPACPAGWWEPADAEIADQALQSAGEALGRWRRMSALDRGRIVVRVAELLAARTETVAELITSEEGKTLAESRGEVTRAVETLRYQGMQAWLPEGQVYSGTDPADLVRTHRVPVGVVSVITPWNFPLLIPAWKIAPALVHGCTVVWKPASVTPLVAAELVRVLVEAGLPPGVLNFVPGSGELGRQLVGDDRTAAVTFTGSERVGREIATTAAARGARCQLELGGHNPAVVLPDADLDQAAGALATSVASMSGQKCTAARRVLVHENVREPLLERLASRLAELRLGDGLLDGVDVGPLVTNSARQEVHDELARALDEGAELITGGPKAGVPDGGHFVAPTVLAAAKPGLRMASEEVFGPVTIALPFATVDEGFALANNTRFGLCAAVFTASERIARRAAEEVDVGMLTFNGPTTGSEYHVPFGGMKASSAPAPKEQGLTARDFFTETKAIYSTTIF